MGTRQGGVVAYGGMGSAMCILIGIANAYAYANVLALATLLRIHSTDNATATQITESRHIAHHNAGTKTTSTIPNSTFPF